MVALTYVVHTIFMGFVSIPRDASQPVAAPSTSLPATIMMGKGPALLFRHTLLDDTYGKLAFVHLDHPESPPTVVDLRCDRVHFAAGHGVCLTARRGIFTNYEAIVFDATFQPRYVLPLRGMPSRVRVSADGRVAAMTVFISGHAYTTSGFSTHTSIIDLPTGASIAPDLEQFTIWREGERFQALDFNVWGVTFSPDPHRFYATLGSGGRTYLIEGDLLTHTAWVRRGDIECPALSLDNRRIAFKKRVGAWGPVTWRLAVLDLRSQQEWLVAESRSVDDQAEWLDDTTLLYALPEATARTAAMHTWAVPADGTGQPRLLATHAYSPVVVRP
jgi:hypothetical protein